MLGSLIPTCANCGRALPADGSPCPSCTLPSPEAAVPATDASEGLVAGRYLLQRRLGRGGAKDVWLAHHLPPHRAVALARVSGPSAWERLRREARLTARLGGHRHIVTVHDVFDDEGTPCLVARYMTRGSPPDRLSRASGGRLEPAEAIRAGREIALALAHAHMHGIVHRDVKPDNVWLDGDGEAALGDFGIALADGETPGGSHGTPLYAAPEQARGEEVTARSDLYALGATLFELLRGRPPREASALEGVPEPLERLVRALLAERPEDRPGAAADVAATLERMIAPAPAHTEAPPGLVGGSAGAGPRGAAAEAGRRPRRARPAARRARRCVGGRHAHGRRGRRARHRQEHAARRACRRGATPGWAGAPRSRSAGRPRVRRLARDRALARSARLRPAPGADRSAAVRCRAGRRGGAAAAVRR